MRRHHRNAGNSYAGIVYLQPGHLSRECPRWTVAGISSCPIVILNRSEGSQLSFQDLKSIEHGRLKDKKLVWPIMGSKKKDSAPNLYMIVQCEAPTKRKNFYYDDRNTIQALCNMISNGYEKILF